MKKSNKNRFDDSFYKLAKEISNTLKENAKDKTTQKEQVEELLLAEKLFKDCINKYGQSSKVWKKFHKKICVQNKSILSAQPYFRVNSKDFSKYVTPSIKNEDIEKLKTFNINFLLIKFIKDNWLGPFPKRAEALYNRVERARRILMENNMPLVISAAQKFYSKTPKNHMELNDMIGVAITGLCSGIDKYCGAYTPVFRSVCLGMTSGKLIKAYSETPIHFYPTDKRIIYKANSIRGREGIEDMGELAEAVVTAFEDDAKKGKSMPKTEIDESELTRLLNAASISSLDVPIDDEGNMVSSYVEDTKSNMEDNLIKAESMTIMLECLSDLDIIDRKILILMGISF